MARAEIRFEGGSGIEPKIRKFNVDFRDEIRRKARVRTISIDGLPDMNFVCTIEGDNTDSAERQVRSVFRQLGLKLL